VLSRYTIQGITVDVMPTGENVVGFSNKWYPEGYKNALEYKKTRNIPLKYLQLHILLQQNWKPLKTGEKMTDVRVLTLKILFLYWKIDLRFGKN
jgi:hypothetical protein